MVPAPLDPCWLCHVEMCPLVVSCHPVDHDPPLPLVVQHPPRADSRHIGGAQVTPGYTTGIIMVEVFIQNFLKRIHITSIKQVKLRRDLAMVFQGRGRFVEIRIDWDERNLTLSLWTVLIEDTYNTPESIHFTVEFGSEADENSGADLTKSLRVRSQNENTRKMAQF